MSEAGFVYTGQEDLVYCFSCNIKLDGWTKHMDPLLRHKEESPTCSFVRQFLRHERGNLVVQRQPVSPQMTSSIRRLQSPNPLRRNSRSHTVVTGLEQGASAFHLPDYTDQATRLQSFKYWGGVLPKEEVAEAGFYMIARRDVVKCFSCHVVLQDWKRTDNVIDRHLRISPICPFLTELLYNDMTTISIPSSTGFVIDPSGTSVVPSSASIPPNQLPSPLATSPLGTVPQSLPSSRADSVTQSSGSTPNISGDHHSMMSYQYWRVGEMQLPSLASFAGPQHQYVNDPQVLSIV